MNRRTITGIATAAALTATGISVTNTLKKAKNPSEGLVQAATVQSQAGATQAQGTQTPAQQFLNKAVPAATTSSSKYGTYTSVMIAQAALESGWGQSTLAKEPNNNLFGIKGTYNGQSIDLNTSEYGANGYYDTNAQFRKYPSYTESFNDNGGLLRNGLSGNSSFYSGAWVEKSNSGLQATQGLQGKYATDPQYAQKLNRIITANNLTQYDPKTQAVNETKTIQQTTALMAAPVDASVAKSIGTVNKGQKVVINKYITYGNGVKYAFLTNLNGWINANALAAASSQAPTVKPAHKYNIVNEREIVKVAGTANLPVLNAPKGTETGQKLASGTRWKVSGYAVVDNIRYNRVGTNQWINDEYCAHGAAANQTASVAKPAKPSTANDAIKVTPASGVVKVNYVPGYGIAVWNTPGKHTTGQYLPDGSRWKVTGTAQHSGQTWYRVGTSQWISGQYAAWDNEKVKAAAQTATALKSKVRIPETTSANTKKSSGVVTVNFKPNAGVTVWTAPGGVPTGKYLEDRTSWKFFKTTEAYGQTWFDLGGNQWVPEQYVYVR